MALFRKRSVAATQVERTALFDEAFQRKLESLALVSRRMASGRERAERKANRAASGVEFAEHRPYVAGDDFRFLDWKVFARSDRLLLKQFEEEADLTVNVLLDASLSMAHAGGEKLDYARQVAAALGYVALANLDRVTIQVFSDGVHARMAPVRGRNRALHLLRFLEKVSAHGTTDFARSAKTFAARETQRGMTLVLTDGYDFEGLCLGLDALRYARHEPVLLLVVDPSEGAPTLRGEWSLVDSESGVERVVTVTDALLRKYGQLRDAHFEQLRAYCREKRVRCFELPVTHPFDQAVLKLLRQGGLVG
jgi:uncharacterized protein (DUF58 family)